ncbi:hypothetical protein SDC9_199326 [bioreactor metagenome]|uniref:Uncharacterized protein n=1 Tax=bioreactor metagenome TaxID=1076179 RepID=A0A645IK90_9ZZZZ
MIFFQYGRQLIVSILVFFHGLYINIHGRRIFFDFGRHDIGKLALFDIPLAFYAVGCDSVPGKLC